MQIPESAQVLIDHELHQLAESGEYSLLPDRRIEIYAALGPSNVTDDKVLAEARKKNTLPALSIADRARARIALISARKVERLWQQACLETEANLSGYQDQPDVRQQEEENLAQRQEKYIEHISVHDVPRAFTPSHILEMAELALKGEIHDYGAFRYEANE